MSDKIGHLSLALPVSVMGNIHSMYLLFVCVFNAQGTSASAGFCCRRNETIWSNAAVCQPHSGVIGFFMLQSTNNTNNCDLDVCVIINAEA